jgi:hypothetical protein
MIRINNIEFKKYNSTKTKKPFYEIIKWTNNPYYSKEQDYRKDGYIDSFGGDFLEKDGHSIQKSFFENKQTCIVIAFIEKGSESYELKSVGDRLLELTKEEKDDFFEVYKLGNKKLSKNESNNSK